MATAEPTTRPTRRFPQPGEQRKSLGGRDRHRAQPRRRRPSEHPADRGRRHRRELRVDRGSRRPAPPGDELRHRQRNCLELDLHDRHRRWAAPGVLGHRRGRVRGGDRGRAFVVRGARMGLRGRAFVGDGIRARQPRLPSVPRAFRGRTVRADHRHPRPGTWDLRPRVPATATWTRAF